MQNYSFLILMFGAVALMMVFGSRNKKKMAAKAKELQESIGPGVRVMTTSGMHATVAAVTDDTLELEIAPGVHTIWARAAVREVLPADEVEYDETEYADADYAELSGQEIEPIQTARPSLDKRRNDVG